MMDGSLHEDAKTPADYAYNAGVTAEVVVRPPLGQQRGHKADNERSKRGRGGPAVPVHRRHHAPERRADDIARMVRAHEHDAQRRVDGEQRQSPLERHRVQHRERRAVGQREAAEPV